MSEDFKTGLMLLGVGMITIFLVLSLVVITGNLLIRFVNRYYPETAGPQKADEPIELNDAFPAKTLAAIVSAVDILTQGKGRVVSVSREK